MKDNQTRVPHEVGDPEIGRRLSTGRLRAGLTQTDIAEKIGVSRQHISNIETGVTSPTLRVLRDYLQACDTDLAEFFYGPLPANQTHQQREYHRHLQALLQDTATAPVITKILDSFMTSTQSSSTTLVQPMGVQARRTHK
jgi:putative transcriptional regulator